MKIKSKFQNIKKKLKKIEKYVWWILLLKKISLSIIVKKNKN